MHKAGSIDITQRYGRGHGGFLFSSHNLCVFFKGVLFIRYLAKVTFARCRGKVKG